MTRTPNMQDYAATCREFAWQRPERFNFAGDVIDAWAADPQQQAIFLVDDAGSETRCSFAELSSASRKLCNVLRDAGVKRGDTAIIMLGRDLAW